MFAILNDKYGYQKQEIELEKFTKESSLWGALRISLAKLSSEKSKDNPNERLIDNPRTFIVFDEEEAMLLQELGEVLGIAGQDNAVNSSCREQVKSVLRLFTEDMKIIVNIRNGDYVRFVYFPVSGSRYLPAISIVRSSYVPQRARA